MERYYYHGIESFLDEDASVLDLFLNIIKSGAIKTRTSLDDNNALKMNHICLYRKNEDVDYKERQPYPIGPMSALDAWINNGLVFVISPDINAYKPIYKEDYKREENETNIIDEWRTNENIPIEKIVGIALPLQTIENEIKDNPDIGKVWYEKLNQVLAIAKEYNWFVVSSEEKDFTDQLDDNLKQKQQTY